MHGAELVSLSGWVEKRLSEDEETRLASSSTAYQRQMELSKSALSSSSLSSSSSSFGAKTPPVGGGAAGMVLRAAYDELLIREPLKGGRKACQRGFGKHTMEKLTLFRRP